MPPTPKTFFAGAWWTVLDNPKFSAFYSSLKKLLLFVWSFEKDATWHNEFVLSAEGERNMTGFDGMQDTRRSVWAPEIHYVNDNFYIVGCMNWFPGDDAEENGRFFYWKARAVNLKAPLETRLACHWEHA